MKSRLKKLLKGVIVSSMATLANTYGAEAMPTYQFSDNPSDDATDEYGESSKNGSIKMLLHLNSDDTYALSGHRSHSSHRNSSHRSHSSHRSGSSHYSHYSSATTSGNTSSAVSPADYTLGSRTLSINTYGADVKALTDLLVKHKYIARSSVGTNYLGYVVYDSEVKNAVRAFQKDAGLSQDGIAGNATITQLQTWVPKVYNLGDRVLKKEMRGADVTQLKNILIDKGFLEKPFVKGETLFDTAIETALKRFQDSIGIDTTGTVDAQTFYFLKKQNDRH